MNCMSERYKTNKHCLNETIYMYGVPESPLQVRDVIQRLQFDLQRCHLPLPLYSVPYHLRVLALQCYVNEYIRVTYRASVAQCVHFLPNHLYSDAVLSSDFQ